MQMITATISPDSRLKISVKALPACRWLFLFILLLTVPLAAADNFYQQVQEGEFEGIHSGGRCGFPVILQIQQQQNPAVLEQLNHYRGSQQVSQDSILSPSGHFMIHFDTTGSLAIPLYDRNSDGFPDYLQFVGQAFDRAWQLEVDSLGFRPPPDLQGSPLSVYPVFCQPLGNLYGSTEFYWEDDIPVLPGLNFPSRIVLNTAFPFVGYPNVQDPVVRDSMAIAVTAAHEFNHALQLGYRIWEPLEFWFIESSATYMEEVVAPQVNDYLYYLNTYFRGTDKPLNTSFNEIIDYGKVVMELMLGQQYSPAVTQEIWERIPQQRALTALEGWLQEQGSNIPHMLADLSTWMYFTGERSRPGFYFEDAALFPPLLMYAADPLQNLPKTVLQDSLPNLSFRWYFSPVKQQNTGRFLLKPIGTGTAGDLQMVAVSGGNANISESPAGVPFNMDLAAGDTLFFAVVNSEVIENERAFTLSAQPLDSTGSNEFLVFPQPFVLSQNEPYITFNNISGSGRIFIFTANGRPVRTLNINPGDQQIIWDLETAGGKTLAAGVYIYRLETDELQKSGKFVVIH
ncbi:MAG: T9SS type A sorting domain-containing protein [Calditrichia bacterium]